MSNQNSIFAIVVAIVVVLGGGWYLVQHDRTPEPGSAPAVAVDDSLVIGMPPLLVTESREGRVVNISLLVIGMQTGTSNDAARVRAAIPNLRSEYKEDLEVFLTDRPPTSLEVRIADFTMRIAEINKRLLGEGTIIKLEVDEPTAKPNDAPVPVKSN